ncbi:MAG: STAS domain-containing protein [Ignavibacteriales bacterium]|nr:STAS domain-containing protein [Ignavibacteriales bacterium]MBI3787642.1 STAS domain-containing protein [Ignavibacteriales bacterium]
MQFEVKKNTDATVLKIKERKLDASVSPELKGEFLVLCNPHTKNLIIDLSDVEFCDSSGLSALLIAERKMRENGGVVKLAGLQKKVLSLIRISRLDRAFHIHDTVAKALRS